MRVSRLEIFGFKSFVERFVLNFDKNMIGIVGPNGCGKSNVVDALRWVLGETHAKQLRGGSFEDLIFNGSDGRRPLGMAEVSLTIQPDTAWFERASQKLDIDSAIEEIDKLNDESLPDADLDSDVQTPDAESINQTSDRVSLVDQKILEIPGLFDVAEIQFTRRLYRSGESEYFINKVPCRLRDMQDVYRLIGLGARGLSIVQQGQIGQFISRKPSERRELIEEAAGISGFRTKMETAIRRLEKTDDNLKRLNDIIIEVEKQVKVLRRQAQRARVRQDLKNELHAAEKELFTLKSARLIHQVDSGSREKLLLEQRLEEGSGSLTEQDARIQEIEGQLHDTEVSIQTLRREKDTSARKLMELEARLQGVRIKLSSLESNREHLLSRISDSSRRLENIDVESSQIEAESEGIREKISKNNEEIALHKSKFNELLEEHALRLSQFVEQSLSLRNATGSNSASSLENDIKAKRSAIEERESLIAETDGLQNQASECARDLKLAEREKSDVEKRLMGVDSEIIAIERQLKTFAEHAIQASGGNNDSLSTNDRVLLSVINVPEKYEKALHGILGERTEYLISRNSQDLLDSYIAKSKLGGKKSRIGILDHLESEQNQRSSSDGGAGLATFLPQGIIPLSDVIQVEDGFQAVVARALNGAFVASSKEVALEFKELLIKGDSNYKSTFVIALESGEMILPWGWCSTQGDGAQLSFTRRLADLKIQKTDIQTNLEPASNKVRELEVSLQNLREKIEHGNSLRRELQQLQKELSMLFQRQGEEERRYAEELRNSERSLRDQLQTVEREKSQIIAGMEQAGARLQSDLEAARKNIERLSKEKDSINRSREEYELKLIELDQEIEESAASVTQAMEAHTSDTSREEQQKIAGLESQIEQLENERVDFQRQLGDIRFEQAEVRRSREAVERELRRATTEVDRAEIELQLLLEDIQKHYPDDSSFILIEPASASDILHSKGNDLEKELSALSETAGSIRKRLEREGEVDPAAIELCEQEESRLDSMTRQMNDLSKAKETLERTIRQLKELSRIRFLETFAVVSEKFKELVPRLFGGGSGHLELLNPEDPLTSGVNIVVRPPGKKITTMELMSGGEKALVATAVLVAVFLYHPGPICVLDEVDAPLDDANLERFLELVKEISDRTQFLLITHNKITMQAADRLIGITMQESGVTTAITVNLEDSANEIEKWAANG